MNDKISTAIEAIGGRKAKKIEFAVEDTCSADALGIQVKGVGRLQFPITDAKARKLIAVARPAPFGVRDETKYDEQVRSTWEIGSDRVELDESWSRTLAAKVEELREKLGLPADGKLTAVPDKMLVYGPGQFFAPHQDSERADGMLASLVVVLPSSHAGGGIGIEHKGTRKVLGEAGGSRLATIVAFYSDCRHEVERVLVGHRITLTYQLIHEKSSAPPRKSSRSGPKDRLADLIQEYFATPGSPSYSQKVGDVPDRFVYLLDHEYTERGLGWQALKGKDRVRVEGLLEVAGRLDCEAFLALADVHENWSCEDDGYGYERYRSRRGRHYRDDDDNDNDNDNEEAVAEDYQLDELIESDVVLRHFVDREGTIDPGVPTHIEEDELCFSVPSDDLKPFKSEHEGYMGNYGNTVERWYHRAAFVMWPRSRTFIVRAKQSPEWAIDELARLLKDGSDKEALSSARSLAPFWGRNAASQEGVSFFAKTAKLSAALGDAALAHELLMPFGPDRLTAAGIAALMVAAERFGLEWSRSLLEGWAKRDLYEAKPFIPVLPLLCRTLASHPWQDGRELATWLLSREIAAFRKKSSPADRDLHLRRGDFARKSFARDVVALLEAAAALDSAEIAAGFSEFLSDPKTDVPLEVLVDVLKACHAGRDSESIRRFRLGRLQSDVLTMVRAELARPVRATNDWSIAFSTKCTCRLCKTLKTFLADARSVEHLWPLAEQDRRHVHSAIDGNELPVEHKTIRTGRPFTLMLTKEKALFVQEKELRAERSKLLVWLEKNAII